jgi:hypothetical protein
VAVDDPIGSVGVAGLGRVEPLGCTPPSVGGVEGMLDESGVGGFTDMPVEFDDPMEELIEEPLIVLAAGAVAEVSVDMPVAAVDEPAHQSLLARTFGEAFM